MTHFLVYVRRSYVRAGAPDVSDAVQVERSVAMLPAGATHEVIADSGGHHSGRTDDRDGWQELVARVKAGRCDGVAVYDLSRLARNARLMLELHAAIERAGIPLLIANMPNTRWDTATGRFMLGQLALAAQYQADVDSERARGIHRALFEDGRHRGPAPYGYRTGHDDARRRTLEVDEAEAAIVRRIFAELAARSFADVGDRLRADGIPAPSAAGWSKFAVREIYHRSKLYLGQVVEHRGLDERPGIHQPILTPELVDAARAGLASRGRGGRRAGPGRTYLLSGVLACGRCDRLMVGHSSGARRRYYVCPVCRRPMVQADPLEAKALEAIAGFRMPRARVDELREELRRRLAGPRDDTVARRRARLEQRLVNLRKQHGWGDVDDATYRREKAETEAMLAASPDVDKLVAFDRHRATVIDLGEALPVLEPEERKRAIALFVERMTPSGEITWTGPARPFFALASAVGMVSRGSSPLTEATDEEDLLAWFTA